MAASADLHRKATEASEAEDQAAVAVAAMRVGAEAPIYGKALVEAAFREIFPDSFQTALPVRNVKVRLLTCVKCKEILLYVRVQAVCTSADDKGVCAKLQKTLATPSCEAPVQDHWQVVYLIKA